MAYVQLSVKGGIVLRPLNQIDSGLCTKRAARAQATGAGPISLCSWAGPMSFDPETIEDFSFSFSWQFVKYTRKYRK